MLRLVSDADVNGHLIRALVRHIPTLDLVRVQDVLPEGTSDPEVLAWASQDDRVVLTNDRSTMIGHAYERVKQGDECPGVIVTSGSQSISRAVSDLEVMIRLMSPNEIRDLVVQFLPFGSN